MLQYHWGTVCNSLGGFAIDSPSIITLHFYDCEFQNGSDSATVSDWLSSANAMHAYCVDLHDFSNDLCRMESRSGRR